MSSHETFETDVKKIKSALHLAREFGVLEEVADDGQPVDEPTMVDHGEFLAVLVDAVEDSQHDKSPASIRTVMRQVWDDRFADSFTIEDWYDANTEEGPECRDIEYPISAMGEILEDIYNDEKNNEAQDDWIVEERFGAFVSALIVALYTISVAEEEEIEEEEELPLAAVS